LNVMPSEPLAQIQQKVIHEIQRYFKETLNRPELLNRIGENVVVFDFIREETAVDIFEQMITSILADLEGQGFSFCMETNARDALRSICLEDLSNGGRGIRNQLETHLLNPLARAVFDRGMIPGQTWHITGAGHEGLSLRQAG